MARLYTQFIQGVECIGDSRVKINDGFELLDNAVQELSGQNVSLSVTVLSAQVQNINTNVTTVSTNLTNLQTSFNTTNIGLSTTLTTYVSSLSVFTPAGSYIGFIPIYQ